MKFKHAATSVAALCFSVTACSGKQINLREAAGLTRSAPDEFTVVSAQPLSVPPVFRLPPPGSETEISKKRAEEASGVNLLRGDGAAPAGEASPVEAEVTSQQKALLDKIGAGEKDAAVRASLDEETARRDADRAKAEASKRSSILSVLRPDAPKQDKIIDASAERERVKETQEAGKTVSGDGAVNAPPARDTGILGKIFNK